MRADSGFATPALYEFCEEEKLQYVVGFARNSRLAATVEPLVEQVQADYDDSGEKQRQFTELVYQADSWDRERRMVAKVEVSERGFNRRFVVTNRDLTAGQLYDHYIGGASVRESVWPCPATVSWPTSSDSSSTPWPMS